MITKSRILLIAMLIISLSAPLFSVTARAEGVQTPNPLFVKAQSLWQQLSSSGMPASKIASFGQRFDNLAREQQALWSLAGQVDHGQCTGTCLYSYNSRVLAWQSDLTAFNSDVDALLKSGRLPEEGK